MRKNKFRVWNLEKEKMYRVIKLSDSFYGDCEESYCHYENEEGKAEFLPLSYGIIMQYTGQKDREGTEIYEGDIIRENDGDGGYIYAEVVYHNCGFMGKEQGFEPEYPISEFRNEAEVIGNIYENPELLEEVQ